MLSRRETQAGHLLHVTHRIKGVLILVHDESSQFESRAPPLGASSPVIIYLYGDEVEHVIEQAIAAGARVLLPA